MMRYSHTLLLPLLIGCWNRTSTDIPTTTATTGEFEITLAISGELQSVRSVTLSSPDLNVQNKITSVIEEGSRVEAGDVLVEFDTTELENNLENARNEYEIAQTKIAQREAQLAVRLGDLATNVTRAKLSLQRAQMRTTESETVPRVERESAKLDVQESTLSIRGSNAALVSARLEGEAELELLRLEAERTLRQVGTVEGLLEDAVLHAPSPGLVILPEIWKGGSRGPISVGDTVWPGSPIVQLPDLSSMEVEAWVHEVDAARVTVGQTCTVVIDAYPDPPHPCTVKKVADLAVRRDRNKKIKHLKVVLELEETDSVMKPGMTVRNELLIDSRSDALSVPIEAVFHEGDHAHVWVSSLRGFTRQAVTVGVHNDTHVIIEEGLTVGDVVALIDPERAAAGEASAPGRPARNARAIPGAS